MERYFIIYRSRTRSAKRFQNAAATPHATLSLHATQQFTRPLRCESTPNLTVHNRQQCLCLIFIYSMISIPLAYPACVSLRFYLVSHKFRCRRMTSFHSFFFYSSSSNTHNTHNGVYYIVCISVI